MEARDGRLGMALANKLGMTAEDRRLHAACTDHVMGDEQEPALPRRAVVLRTTSASSGSERAATLLSRSRLSA